MSGNSIQSRTYEDLFRDVVGDIAAVFVRPVDEVAEALANDSERWEYLQSLARAVKRDENVFVATGTAARMLGRSAKTILRWTEAGKLACRRTPGRNHEFALSELRRMKKVLECRL